MKLQHLFLFSMLAIVAACSSDDKAKMAAIGSDFSKKAIPPVDEQFNKQPANTILSFLQWYRAHEPELKKIELVNHSANPDSAQYYVVNDAGADQYLAELEKSGFVTERYIKQWRTYLAQCSE